MRVEFSRPAAPDDVVGRARWDGKRAEIESDDDEVRASLEKVFRDRLRHCLDHLLASDVQVNYDDPPEEQFLVNALGHVIGDCRIVERPH